jgi:hypothetical protein
MLMGLVDIDVLEKVRTGSEEVHVDVVLGGWR